MLYAILAAHYYSALYLILFMVTMSVIVRRNAEGRKWNLCLIAILFVGNTVYQVAGTISVLSILSLLQIGSMPDIVLSFLSMAMLAICQ
jgi:hypothetical protein